MTNTMTTTLLRPCGRENGPKGMAKVRLHEKVALETDLSARVCRHQAQALTESLCDDRRGWCGRGLCPSGLGRRATPMAVKTIARFGA
jgi:hypothetical protein